MESGRRKKGSSSRVRAAPPDDPGDGLEYRRGNFSVVGGGRWLREKEYPAGSEVRPLVAGMMASVAAAWVSRFLEHFQPFIGQRDVRGHGRVYFTRVFRRQWVFGTGSDFDGRRCRQSPGTCRPYSGELSVGARTLSLVMIRSCRVADDQFS